MGEDNKREKLILIFSNILGIKPKEVTDDLNRETLGDWDSLNHLLLINEVENKFNISIPIEESVEMNSFKDILKFITNAKEKTSDA